jgi:hypothetical protein
MFRNDEPAPRRAGMLAAGVVLLVGAGLVFAEVVGLRMFDGDERHRLAYLVLGSWVAAAVAGACTYAVVAFNPSASARPVGTVGPFTTFCVGAALLAPITVHLIVLSLSGWEPRKFAEWAGIALPITATAHIAFAILVGSRAARLAAGRTDAPSVGSIFRTTVVVSAIPFGLLFLMPPALVAVTGIPLLPLLYAMEKYALADRGAIMLPVARLV